MVFQGVLIDFYRDIFLTNFDVKWFHFKTKLVSWYEFWELSCDVVELFQTLERMLDHFKAAVLGFLEDKVIYWKCNYDPSCRSVGQSAGWSFCHNFLKGWISYTSMLLSEYLLKIKQRMKIAFYFDIYVHICTSWLVWRKEGVKFCSFLDFLYNFSKGFFYNW